MQCRCYLFFLVFLSAPPHPAPFPCRLVPCPVIKVRATSFRLVPPPLLPPFESEQSCQNKHHLILPLRLPFSFKSDFSESLGEHPRLSPFVTFIFRPEAGCVVSKPAVRLFPPSPSFPPSPNGGLWTKEHSPASSSLH